MEKLKQIMTLLTQKVKSHPKTTIAICIPLVLGFIIRKQQYRIIYIPQMPQVAKSPAKNPYPYRHPAQYGLVNSKDVEIQTRDGKILRGWYVSPINQIKPDRLILYYHQNAGNIGFRLPFIKFLVQQTRSDVLLIAYRGYSDSQGRPSQKGLKIDGQSIMKYAISQSKAKKLPLIVFGRSLGGAVATYACSKPDIQKDVNGLILQNTFTSISDVAQHLFSNNTTRPIMKFILFFLISNHWQSYKLINRIKIPKLFIKSGRDQLIPITQMNTLQKLCDPNTRSQQYIIKNGTHNQTYSLQQSIYSQRLNRFFSSL